MHCTFQQKSRMDYVNNTELKDASASSDVTNIFQISVLNFNPDEACLFYIIWCDIHTCIYLFSRSSIKSEPFQTKLDMYRYVTKLCTFDVIWWNDNSYHVSKSYKYLRNTLKLVSEKERYGKISKACNEKQMKHPPNSYRVISNACYTCNYDTSCFSIICRLRTATLSLRATTLSYLWYPVKMYKGVGMPLVC